MVDTKRYRIDCDYGKVLFTLLDGYARVQGITTSSLLRQLVSESFRNELNNIEPGYQPKVTRRSE